MTQSFRKRRRGGPTSSSLVAEFFSLPGNAGFDSTPLTLVTLPLFFGLMTGDYGCGVAFVLIGMLARRFVRTPMMDLASALMIFGGLWCFVFGIVFGEFFGFHIDLPLLGFHLVDKLSDLDTLLLLSVIIGIAHVNLGLAVGFLYEKRRAGLTIAFLRKLSW